MLTPLLLALNGCAYDEHLPQVDVHGTLVVPRAAATRDVVDERTGEVTAVTDSRWIGPIFMGAYSGVDSLNYGYPHPEIGPVIGATSGNTYPYGGGSLGRFDFACFESLVCEVNTGRFADFESMIEWFNDTINEPIIDDFGSEVDSPDYFRSYCYDLLNFTDDYELSFVACPDGREGCNGLHFEENGDGDFQAEFDLWQVTYQPKMQIWGWMDSPGEDFNFTTCDPDKGQRNTEYANDFEYGTNYEDLLNFPQKYIGSGDYLVQDPYITQAEDADGWRNTSEQASITFDYLLEN